MTQTTTFSETSQVDLLPFATWFPAAEPSEIAARQSDFNALIEYLSKANDLTWSETLDTLDLLRLGAGALATTTELRAA